MAKIPGIIEAKRSPGIPPLPEDLVGDEHAQCYHVSHWHGDPKCRVRFVGTGQGMWVVCERCLVAARLEEVGHRCNHTSSMVLRGART